MLRVEALVFVLFVTNLVTAGLLAWMRHDQGGAQPADPDVLAALAAQRASGPRSRRLISIEVLNPVELAGTRGRVIGIAGSFVPALTRRIVYEQTLRELRKQLSGQGVVADVRMHRIESTVTVTRAAAPQESAAPAGPASVTAAPAGPAPGESITVDVVVESTVVDLDTTAEASADYVDPYPGPFDPFVRDPFEEPAGQEPT